MKKFLKGLVEYIKAGGRFGLHRQIDHTCYLLTVKYIELLCKKGQDR